MLNPMDSPDRSRSTPVRLCDSNRSASGSLIPQQGAAGEGRADDPCNNSDTGNTSKKQPKPQAAGWDACGVTCGAS